MPTEISDTRSAMIESALKTGSVWGKYTQVTSPSLPDDAQTVGSEAHNAPEPLNRAFGVRESLTQRLDLLSNLALKTQRVLPSGFNNGIEQVPHAIGDSVEHQTLTDEEKRRITSREVQVYELLLGTLPGEAQLSSINKTYMPFRRNTRMQKRLVRLLDDPQFNRGVLLTDLFLNADNTRPDGVGDFTHIWLNCSDEDFQSLMVAARNGTLPEDLLLNRGKLVGSLSSLRERHAPIDTIGQSGDQGLEVITARQKLITLYWQLVDQGVDNKPLGKALSELMQPPRVEEKPQIYTPTFDARMEKIALTPMKGYEIALWRNSQLKVALASLKKAYASGDAALSNRALKIMSVVMKATAIFDDETASDENKKPALRIAELLLDPRFVIGGSEPTFQGLLLKKMPQKDFWAFMDLLEKNELPACLLSDEEMGRLRNGYLGERAARDYFIQQYLEKEDLNEALSATKSVFPK